ncbi:hypothetical protein AB0G60_09335 [Streptomyces angustmyceticus]|uniref:Uncharacterized protein n=1 Tax=Streptomyces angustmyceticus TaxID=285578 RepID=A0A5J4LES0_9ACTN|nr:hypothetical protein [Streptomyces angustmyceticus]UAL67868.1 hypothetical protein K7396_16160 [Streptomyces angustmyceticus]GES31004.1 hypothetical protein San01_34910 [Streptomyces angustmyceticus]
MRDKKVWIAALVTVLTSLAVLIAQGGWDWLTGELSEPPGLTAYAPSIDGCAPRYFDDGELKELGTPEQVRRGGVMIPTAELWPTVHVTLQAKTGQAIVVTGAQVSVLSSRSLPERGAVVKATDCGGGMDERAFDVDLRATPVALKPTVERTAQGAVVRSRDFPYKVSSGDPEQLAFHVKNVDRDVRFAITLKWVSEGEPGRTRLDNGGRGYRVMALPKSLPRYDLAEVVGHRPAR